jgi:phosphate transport system substrate-binding protein
LLGRRRSGPSTGTQLPPTRHLFRTLREHSAESGPSGAVVGGTMTRTMHVLLVLLACLSMSCAYWSDRGTTVATKEPTATGSHVVASQPPKVAAPEGDVVRLVGSTTIGSVLAPRLAVGFLVSLAATDVTTQLGAPGANHVTVGGVVQGRRVRFEIEYPGSGAAFDCLAAGSCDIGMSSRPVQSDEVEKLKALGDMTEDACEHVLAMDGLAMIVHRSNPITKLTVQQISAIFSGEVRSWSQVGGGAGDVHVVTRDKASGTYDTFVHFALGGRDVTARAKVVDGNEAVAKAVAADEGAIGFVGLPYVGETKAVAVQDGAAASLLPTALNVSTEDYAFSRRLFFYTAASPKSALAQKLVDYALSDAGQAVVPQTGFVSLDVRSQAVPAPTDAPPAYVKATSGAQRLTFNFRFKGGTAKLDPRSVKDLERMARFIRVASSNARGVALFGFTDNQGSEQKNVELSRQRAMAIADRLRERGIEPQTVDGFGSTLPIAPNDTPVGRVRNRRIEVWLR